ncbi:MAG: SDR family oxidoreductase [Dehalococcoidia bacterium]|nr:SDR family oxidoreductase [Dehalococcoidia bacterium]
MAVVVITGCSSGFGMLAALEFAHRGDSVYATMRNTAKADRLHAGAEAAGVAVEVLQLDVNEIRSVSAAIEEVIRRKGRIDVLVNNAGIGIEGAVEDFDDDEVLAVFETNLFGVIRVTRAVLPQMRSQGSGTIVTVGSLAGKATAPFSGIYSASKHAVEALSDALYYELQPFGIRVVLIEPGGFETEIETNSQRARRFTEASVYLEAERRFAEALERLPGGWLGADAKIVADVIVDVAKAAQPQRRYLVGQDAELIGGLHKRMSDEEFENAVRTLLDWH